MSERSRSTGKGGVAGRDDATQTLVRTTGDWDVSRPRRAGSVASKEEDGKTFEHLVEMDIGFSSLFALRLDQQDPIKCLDIVDQNN